MLCDCSILSIHHSSNANVFVWQWISLSCGFRPFNRTLQCFYVMWRMTGSVRTVNIGAREMSKIFENHGWQPSAPSRIHRGRGLCLYSASALQRSECWISGSDGVGKCFNWINFSEHFIANALDSRWWSKLKSFLPPQQSCGIGPERDLVNVLCSTFYFRICFVNFEKLQKTELEWLKQREKFDFEPSKAAA